MSLLFVRSDKITTFQERYGEDDNNSEDIDKLTVQAVDEQYLKESAADIVHENQTTRTSSASPLTSSLSLIQRLRRYYSVA